MHNNFYFLRQLSTELEQELKGFTLVSCFSQNKDELVLEFNNRDRSFFIKVSLEPEFQCLSFPVTFHRARKNSIDLFPEIVLKAVRGARQFNNERSFALLLDDGYALVFKMHGRQGNVLLFRANRIVAVFRNNFPADLMITLDSLDRTVDWSRESFEVHQHDLRSRYITFGTPVWDHLDRLGFKEKSLTARWVLLQDVKAQLEHPSYFIVSGDHGIRLTLLPAINAEAVFAHPVQAINEFFFLHQSRSGLDKERSDLLAAIRGRLKQSRAFLEKTRARLSEVESDHHYQLWGDLVMANIHRIKQGVESVDLENFHEIGKTVSVKLKKELSPQRNAETFYRKAKNRAIELRTLTEILAQKEKTLSILLEQEQAIIDATDRLALQPFVSLFSSQAKEKQRKETMPYHEHTFNGYRILVGKNAAANDELTLHHTFKEDLWLHAKDVAGSHVVIKHQSGKSFPKDVIEYAAGLAAFHSKRKNESLCPVAVTPAKYVRKRKGDPPGAVIVQREDVVMIEPWRGKGSGFLQG